MEVIFILSAYAFAPVLENSSFGLVTPIVTSRSSMTRPVGQLPVSCDNLQTMSTVEEIKAAAAKLNPDEQVELFRWWVESDAFKARHLAALKRDLAAGLDQLDHGSYRSYDDSNLMQLAEE